MFMLCFVYHSPKLLCTETILKRDRVAARPGHLHSWGLTRPQGSGKGAAEHGALPVASHVQRWSAGPWPCQHNGCGFLFAAAALGPAPHQGIHRVVFVCVKVGVLTLPAKGRRGWVEVSPGSPPGAAPAGHLAPLGLTHQGPRPSILQSISVTAPFKSPIASVNCLSSGHTGWAR